MRVFQMVLVSLCIGLVGAVAIILVQPVPAAFSNQYIVRPEISTALVIASRLTDARDYGEAVKLIDVANAFSNKTKPEIQEIDQARDWVRRNEARDVVRMQTGRL
jgi:hypothetical protein